MKALRLCLVVVVSAVLIAMMLGFVTMQKSKASPISISGEQTRDADTHNTTVTVEAVDTTEASDNDYLEGVLPTEDKPKAPTDAHEPEGMEMKPTFEIFPIDETILARMAGSSYPENATIALEDLRYLKVSYYGYDGESHQGELIVNQAIAESVIEIFKKLYASEFPIESMVLIDAFGGDDDMSMNANNTSAFNYRLIAGTDRLSNHSFGLAIDINPLVNPYVTSHGIYPEAGRAYADRGIEVQGMIHKNDVCYNAFIEAGFTWGGEWQNSKDYQHFEYALPKQ